MNRGWKCRDCGNVSDKSKERTINKVKFKACYVCSGIVDKWERPLNERAGRCEHCAHGGFILSIKDGKLFRRCKKCERTIDVHTSEIVQEGKRRLKYNASK